MIIAHRAYCFLYLEQTFGRFTIDICYNNSLILFRVFGSVGIIQKNLWHASISNGDISIHCFFQMLVSSKSLSLIESGIPASSKYLSGYTAQTWSEPFQVSTFSARRSLTFLHTNDSQFSCLYLSSSRGTVSVKFWFCRINYEHLHHQSLYPLIPIIFFTNSGFFNRLMAFAERSNKFWPALPIIIKSTTRYIC